MTAPLPGTTGSGLAGARVHVVGGGRELRDAVRAEIEAAGGRALPSGRAGAAAEGDVWLHLGALAGDSAPPLPRLFAELKPGALAGARTILVATAVGGSFAHAGSQHPRPECEARIAASAGVRGMLRTLARELPDTVVRGIDLDPDEPAERLARTLVAELGREAGPIDIGHRAGACHTLQLEPSALDRTRAPAFELEPQAVLLVTGGARGIGARTSIALAREYGCHVELIGRSPLPQAEEPRELAAAADAPALRRALITHTDLSTPAAIEAECARLLAAREIRANLAELEQHAASVRYHAVDVRDAGAFGAVLREIRARHGRIDGVIHAAGVLEDRWIRDKSPESFERVFDTKIAAFRTLARELPAEVRFVASFGSIAGAFGNRGQVDYAAANEALALWSRWLASRIQGRVVTLHWGPWGGGGMVTPELEREYARRGIGLIEPGDGVRCLLDELRHGGPADVEVVWMRAEPGEWSACRSGGAADPAATASVGDLDGAARGAALARAAGESRRAGA